MLSNRANPDIGWKSLSLYFYNKSAVIIILWKIDSFELIKESGVSNSTIRPSSNTIILENEIARVQLL